MKFVGFMKSDKITRKARVALAEKPELLARSILAASIPGNDSRRSKLLGMKSSHCPIGCVRCDDLLIPRSIAARFARLKCNQTDRIISFSQTPLRPVL